MFDQLIGGCHHLYLYLKSHGSVPFHLENRIVAFSYSNLVGIVIFS